MGFITIFQVNILKIMLMNSALDITIEGIRECLIWCLIRLFYKEYLDYLNEF